MKAHLIILGLLLGIGANLCIAQQPFYDVTTGTGNGLRFWQNDWYKIHMGTGTEYHFGPVTDYGIKMNMSPETGRGWIWGIMSQVPVAALSNQGNMQIAGTFQSSSLLATGAYGSTSLPDATDVVTPQLKLQATSGYIRIPHLSASTNVSAVYNFETGKNVYWGEPTDAGNYIFRGRAVRLEGASGGVVGTGTGSRLELSTGIVTSIEENWGINLIGNDASPVKIRNAALLVGYSSSSAGWGTSGNLLVQGNVGIGTTSPDAKLAVSGVVHAQEVKVSLTVPGPDYVFERNYKLPSLEEIKSYIDQNKHLPEVPSAAEMETNGLQLGEMNMLLLKKVEELTLYVIEQNKKIELQRQKNEVQQRQIDKLSAAIKK